MAFAKISKNGEGKDMHSVVGAIIKLNDKYLMMDRQVISYGYACCAGHIDEGENANEALIREVKEETGFDVVNQHLLFETERYGDMCTKDFRRHYWYVYEVEVKGQLNRECSEFKTIEWLTVDQIKELNNQDKLESVWREWFTRLKIL